MGVALDFADVTKSFRDASKHVTVAGAFRRLQAGNGPRRRVLDGVSFTVTPGERVALLGDNGAGKTTLLKTAAGLLRPDSGRIDVAGQLSFLAGLGVGMLDDLTVAENLYLYGATHRLHREDLTPRLPEILAWAGLDGLLSASLRTLSTGMRTRLAFSVVRHVAADVHLLDEVLTAGDLHFRRKCRSVLRDWERDGRTILVATHDLDLAAEFCTRAIWLRKGRVEADGTAPEVSARYREARPA